MSSFTTKTVQPLEPGVSGVALDSVGIAHETAQAFGATLEDLAMLAYRRGKARFKLKLSTASTAGAATVRFLAGSVQVGTKDIAIGGAGAAIMDTLDLNLGGVAGETPITMQVEMTTAADAGVTAEVYGRVEVSTPLVVSGC
jgi:hypothetical protein